MATNSCHRLKVAVLCDPYVLYEGLWGAHGLAIYIEAYGLEPKRLLFGVGPSYSLLTHNAEEMGLDLKLVDLVVVPLSGRPHSGALNELLKRRIVNVNDVYVPYGSGLPGIQVEKALTPIRGCTISPPIGLWRKELSLFFKVGEKTVVFIGCAHPGPVKYFQWLERICVFKDVKGKIYSVIGGLHTSSEDRMTLEELSKIMHRWGVEKMIPLYCTSFNARRLLSGVGETGVGLVFDI